MLYIFYTYFIHFYCHHSYESFIEGVKNEINKKVFIAHI